jgi:hypothetical protein
LKDHQGVGDLHKLIEDYREKQRNIVWPDPLINATRADRFLWNGSPNPTRVQRVASWLVGSVLFAQGLSLFGWAIRERASFGSVLILVSLASAFTFGGIRIFRNGFGKRVRGPVLVPDKDKHRS